MYVSGTTLAEIGEEFGVSKQRVHQVLVNNGVQMRERGTPSVFSSPRKQKHVTQLYSQREPGPPPPPCIDGTRAHHWKIEAPNGEMSRGVCARCHIEHWFYNSMKYSYVGHLQGADDGNDN